ncbi:MAG TPA: hypothetical protein VHO90_22020 [Bacteroidales bacterium]|nr:hypothetical protein [Bacteroidales bacterium]
MSINEVLKDSIINQFAANSKLNLFYNNLDFQNHFLEETKDVIKNYKLDLLHLDEENRSEEWVTLMTERALDVFCKNNQYIDAREANVSELQNVYRVLWEEIVRELNSDEVNFDALQKSHLTRLSDWFIKTNSFVKDLNDPESSNVIEVACSEYSADFQMQLLNIDLKNLREPVLDIGCGKDSNLVNYLCEKGIQAYGIDRLLKPSENLFRVDWLDFEFLQNTWGTIISNQSFALHFTNHHYRKDGEYILYARKYMEILNSLKPAGCFYYAPGLPFIEAYLPKDKYKATTYRINEAFSSTKVMSV